METDEILNNAIRDGIREGVKTKFANGYNTPLDKLIQSAIEANSVAFKGLLEEAINSAVKDDSFRVEIISATRSALAKVLIRNFGGELEKQVNALKSDPVTRARIVMAIEEITKKNS